MPRIRNKSTGARGAYANGALIMAEPGETIEADDFHPEWFEEVGEQPLSRKTKAELLDIAASEGVEADDSMTNAAIVEAIEAGRAG